MYCWLPYLRPRSVDGTAKLRVPGQIGNSIGGLMTGLPQLGHECSAPDPAPAGTASGIGAGAAVALTALPEPPACAGGGATTNTPGTPSLTSLAERRCTVEVVTLTSGGTFGEPLCQGPSQQNPRLGQQVPAAGAKPDCASDDFHLSFDFFQTPSAA